MSGLLVLLLLYVAIVVTGFLVGDSRGRPLTGLFLALVLGPLGLLLALFLPAPYERGRR